MPEQNDTLEEIAHYHRCVAARCRKNAASDVASPVESRASDAAAAMHERWAEAIDEHLHHHLAEEH